MSTENNKAIITTIKTKPHPNADRVQLATTKIGSFQVIVGLDVQNNDLGILFPSNTKLGKDFVRCNESLLTYFDKNYRVRQQKFRGEWSEGFWCPIQTLEKIGCLKEYNEGDYVDVVEDLHEVGKKYEICSKFIVPTKVIPATVAKKKAVRRGSLPTFQKHFDTEHLRLHTQDVMNTENRIVTTLKIHGTSARTGYVEMPEESLNWYQKLFYKYFNAKYYEFLIGSRNVIFKVDTSTDCWYSTNFRSNVASIFFDKLKPNEVVYYEIVGYDGEKALFKHSLESIKDNQLKKELSEVYPNNIIYDYGLNQGEWEIYVYRIAYEFMDGTTLDLTWDEVKDRCVELGVKYVPEVDQDIGYGVMNGDSLSYYVGDISGPDPIDHAHPQEGVVLRIDSTKPKFYKFKSPIFLSLEGFDNHPDLEDNS